MECKRGAETVVRFIQANYAKAEYQQCPKCFRQHVHASHLEQFEKISRLQDNKGSDK